MANAQPGALISSAEKALLLACLPERQRRLIGVRKPMHVKGLLQYGLQVPSLEVGRVFYTDFGLQVAERGCALAVRCDGREMDQALLTEGSRKQLQFVSFAVEAGSLPEWQRRLESAGTSLVDAPVQSAQGGLWFTDPDGVHVNLREDDVVPWRKAAPEESMFNFGDEI